MLWLTADVKGAADALDADVLFVSSGIAYDTVARLQVKCAEIDGPREKGVLLLTTWGGRPDAGYLIARNLRAIYPNSLTVCVFGFCKSAGTLVALGGDEIVIGQQGELGPIDTQVSQPDELERFGSGLEIFASLDVLAARSATMFSMLVRSIVERSHRQISTRTAAELAADLTIGLMKPIAKQIDPLRLGRRQRSLDVAKEYAARLGVPLKVAEELTTAYPEHGFVIDLPEAQRLLGESRARAPNEKEKHLEAVLAASIPQGALRSASNQTSIIEFLSTPKESNEHEN